jgi:NosR/NirI family nitrous oxide reductase transcriptional regulator
MAALTRILAALSSLAFATGLAAEPSQLAHYMQFVPADQLVAEADRYGPVQDAFPVAPILQGDEQVGWAFLNTDIVSANGYSSRPIHVLVAINSEAVLIGARLLDQSEPLLQSGRRRVEVGEMVAAVLSEQLGLSRGRAPASLWP